MLTSRSFQQVLDSTKWFRPDLKILVACSGGIDSTVLLHLFHNLPHMEITVVHFNHQIRGLSGDKDMAFVTDYVASLQHRLHIISEDIPAFAKESGLSLEEAGSRRRRSAFLGLREVLGYDLVATGQHQDDQIETVLLNLYSGSGIQGLAAISGFGGSFIRPLLTFSRAEIQAYAKTNELKYRFDKSNTDISFLRNNIRMTMLPSLLKQNGSSIRASINWITSQGNVLNEMIQKQIETVDIKEFKGAYKPKIALGMGGLPDYFSPIQKAIFDRAFQLISLMPQGISTKHFEALKSLFPEAAIAKEVQLPAKVTAVRDRRNIIFFRRSDFQWYQRKITLATREIFPFFQFDYCAAVLKQHITDPHYFWYVHNLESYLIRTIKEGDRMKVDENEREVSVNQMLQSARVAPHLKAYYPVMEYQKEIIWVPGIRTSHSAMIARSQKKENVVRHCIRVQFQEGTCE